LLWTRLQVVRFCRAQDLPGNRSQARALKLGILQLVDRVLKYFVPGVLLAAAVERFSEHPLARAIVEYAEASGAERLDAEAFEAQPGRGVRARIEGQVGCLPSLRCLTPLNAWRTRVPLSWPSPGMSAWSGSSPSPTR